MRCVNKHVVRTVLNTFVQEITVHVFMAVLLVTRVISAKKVSPFCNIVKA